MHYSRAAAVTAAVLLCFFLLSDVVDARRRPGPLGGRRGRRMRPTAQEIFVMPENAVEAPPPERSSVEALPEVPFLPEAVAVGAAEEEIITAQAACGTVTKTDISPLRTQWDSGNGYCGEMSLQLAAMTRGVYISQQTSRAMGVPPGADHPDLLFESRSGSYGIYHVAKKLGFYQPSESFWFMDNQTLSSSKVLSPRESSFTQWLKQNVIAGRPVIGGFRVKNGGYFDYDHIMPVYGACYSSANSLASSDQIIFTDNYGSELKHQPSDTYFYAGFHKCGYTGCIPNDYYDMGVAVGPLNVPANVYYPVKLQITGWSDGTRTSYEPAEGAASTSATAAYSLTIKGLTVGQTYRVYRTTGLFSSYQIPQSAANLATACAAQGSNCRSIDFTATATSQSVSEASVGTGSTALGRFNARGVTYFLVVKV